MHNANQKNLDRLEEHCKRSIRYDAGKRFREHEIVLELLDKYKQLETRDQKLIDKLEEDIAENKELYKNTSEDIKLYRVAKINYAQEILSIIKLQSSKET